MNTTIQIDKSTREALKRIERGKETYDEVLVRLCDETSEIANEDLIKKKKYLTLDEAEAWLEQQIKKRKLVPQ